jgi:predicted Zn-dependent peptidase
LGRFIPLGGNWVYRREYLSLQDELAAWLAVTKEQVAAVACRFRLDATTLVALGPLESL